MHNVQCSMHNVQYAMHNVQYLFHNVQCPIHNVQCAMHNVQCAMHNVQCTMHNVQWAKNIAIICLTYLRVLYMFFGLKQIIRPWVVCSRLFHIQVCFPLLPWSSVLLVPHGSKHCYTTNRYMDRVLVNKKNVLRILENIKYFKNVCKKSWIFSCKLWYVLFLNSEQ